MERKVIEETKENGVHKKIETIETNYEDGFVKEQDINPIDPENYGKYHKGYTKSTIITTNDPRIIKPFIYGICTLFLVIGIIFLLFRNYLFGTIFILITTYTFYKIKREIDKIEQELKENNNYDNSVEETRKVQKEFFKNVKEGWTDSKRSVFTKENFKKIIKVSIPIYCIVTITIFLVISILVNLILGLFILFILTLGGVVYYLILYKICKW